MCECVSRRDGCELDRWVGRSRAGEVFSARLAEARLELLHAPDRLLRARLRGGPQPGRLRQLPLQRREARGDVNCKSARWRTSLSTESTQSS